MEEELKKIKSQIKKLKKHCETWIKYTEDNEKRDIYLKIYNELDEIVRN